MLRMNGRASEILSGSFVSVSWSHENELEEILREGVGLHDNLLLLNKKIRLTKQLADALQDETGIECFINHIHIDDYISLPDWPNYLLYSLYFSGRLKQELSKFELPCRIIISMVEGNNISVRFHVMRNNQIWLDDNIDSYEGAIIVIE